MMAPTPSSSSGSGGPSSLSNAEFYARFPYVQPADILPYLRAAAVPGDIGSALRAIDEFAERYPMFRSGPEKGAILEQLVARQQPALALELGTFMGYGTMRIWRQLPPGGRVVTVEASEAQAEVAREVLRFAGLPVGVGPNARVQVVSGLSGEVLPRLRQLAGLPAVAPAGFVFLDHCKPCYLPDLLAMERLGLVGAGTLVLADNVLVPGAPDYLAHVGAASSRPQRADDVLASGGSSSGGSGQAGGLGSSSGSSSSGGDDSGSSTSGSAAAGGSSEGFAYRTQLVATAFEVEERYKADWQPKQDAMSVSLCVAAA